MSISKRRQSKAYSINISKNDLSGFPVKYKTKRYGIFCFFQKEKKETLDKGLAKTKEGMFSKLARAVAGKSTVDDDILDNLEEILITSDVGVETTLRIIERIEQRVARDKYLSTSELKNILREEIVALLTENNTGDENDFVVPRELPVPMSSWWWA